MLKGLYDIDRRFRRWYMRIVQHLFGVCVINAWLCYRRDAMLLGETGDMHLLTFLGEVAEGLTKFTGENRRSRGRPSNESNTGDTCTTSGSKRQRVSFIPSNDLRYDTGNHFPEYGVRGRCRLCHTGYSRWQCDRCRVILCLNNHSNCFKTFHV